MSLTTRTFSCFTISFIFLNFFPQIKHSCFGWLGQFCLWAFHIARKANFLLQFPEASSTLVLRPFVTTIFSTSVDLMGSIVSSFGTNPNYFFGLLCFFFFCKFRKGFWLQQVCQKALIYFQIVKHNFHCIFLFYVFRRSRYFGLYGHQLLVCLLFCCSLTFIFLVVYFYLSLAWFVT